MKLKILVTGRGIPAQADRCTAQQLARGFAEAGHDAIFYGNFYNEPYRWLGAKEATTEEFDLIIATEMNDGMRQYDLPLNLKGVPRIYWDFDVSYNPNSAYNRASFYQPDAFLVGNKYFLGADGFGRFNKPVLHLPYACSPTIHRRKPEVAKTDMFGFVGNVTPERKTMLESVKCVTGVFGERLIDATNALYFMVHVNQDACKGLVPGRPFESAGCGTNLLMDRASYEDFEEFIPEELLGVPVSPFATLDDIVKIKESFDMPGGKEHLEQRGMELMRHMHENHSYRNRALQIVEFAKSEGLL